MAKRQPKKLDFIIDKLTNSIENVISGDSFSTEISLLTKSDLKQIKKGSGWRFNWKNELNDNSKEVYKLTITNNLSIVQGLISLTIKTDHLYIHLLESAPFNIGKRKIYEGVPGNLVAYASRISFQHGFEGYVSFISKTKLIDHYIKKLGAAHAGGHLMIIKKDAAQKLIDTYFKN